MKTWITPEIEALDVRMTKSGDTWANTEGITTTNKIGETRTTWDVKQAEKEFLNPSPSPSIPPIVSPTPTPTIDDLLNES